MVYVKKWTRTPRGCGGLTVEQQDAAVERLMSGETQASVAKDMGVSKNIIAGAWARYGAPGCVREPTTVFDRCNALHAKMDAVLAATSGVPRVPNTPPPRR